MKINAIITGSTGMVGEGVLHVCLNSPKVESVLVVNRQPCGVNHPKLKEIIHKDFMDLASIENEFVGYNACYFCAGVSSIGKSENEYTHITYDLTLNFAKILLKANASKPISSNNTIDSNLNLSQALTGGEKVDLVFTYVSGVGTDSSEKGKNIIPAI